MRQQSHYPIITAFKKCVTSSITTNRGRLDAVVVVGIAFRRRRRRARLDSQIATAVSQTSPDLKDEREAKKSEAGQIEKIQAWVRFLSKGTKFLYM